MKQRSLEGRTFSLGEAPALFVDVRNCINGEQVD